MKRLLAVILSIMMLSISSCTVVTVTEKKDNGKHKGWYKNPNNPHNPHTTKGAQPKGHIKSNGKSNKK